jgi:NAD(P)-dependent dehydrogenase (short-subunit alcohol dehydrogenase family)
MRGLMDKVALITGAGSGIGAVTAKRLADEGATVVIIGRTENALKETAEQHKNIHYCVVDINHSEELDSLLDFVKKEFGKLDILVNNAGVAPVGPLGTIPESDIQKTLTTNIQAVLELSQKALPLLKEAKGTIINIGSANASRPLQNMSLYSASKAALVAMTRSWAKELALDGVRVNSVSVGPIWTPIYDKTSLSKEEAEKHVAMVKKLVPMGRFGRSEEVASVIAFLASEEASFVTGSDYTVDGGMCA